MPYNTKELKKDFLNKIVAQHFSDALDDYDVRKGRNGAAFSELVDSTGTPFNTSDGKLPVKGAVSLDLTTDGVTNRVVAKISQTAGENTVKDADAGAKVDSATLPAGGSGKIGWLSAIWAKLGAVVLAASDVIIGRVKLTNGTNVASVDADGSVLTKLTGSTVDKRGLLASRPTAASAGIGTTYWSIDTGDISVSDGTAWKTIGVI